MKKYMAILKNWRCVVLALMWTAALLCIMGDNASLAVVLVKAAGMAIGWAGWKLGTRWQKAGLLEELKVFNDEDGGKEDEG